MFLGGTTIEVAGTFTKTVGDGTGRINITLPSDDDEVIFMYGQFASQTHAGAAANMIVSIRDSAPNVLSYMASASVDANQTVNLPTAFADATVAVTNDMGMPTIYQRLVSGTDGIDVRFEGMKFATSETFTFRAKFRSKTGAALTVTPSGGTWA